MKYKSPPASCKSRCSPRDWRRGRRSGWAGWAQSPARGQRPASPPGQYDSETRRAPCNGGIEKKRKKKRRKKEKEKEKEKRKRKNGKEKRKENKRKREKEKEKNDRRKNNSRGGTEK
jgi:hypothetical protein